MRNVFAAWTHYGVIISIFVFIVLQAAIIKGAILLGTNSKRDERG